MRPLTTYFDGYRFRSRTEAKYGVTLKSLGLRYEFERQGFALEPGAFLPDFYLPDLPLWIEVKPFEPDLHQKALCESLAAESGTPAVILCGQPAFDVDALYFTPLRNIQMMKLPMALAMHGISTERARQAIDAGRAARFEFEDAPLLSYAA